jgi:hypothetical protein
LKEKQYWLIFEYGERGGAADETSSPQTLQEYSKVRENMDGSLREKPRHKCGKKVYQV